MLSILYYHTIAYYCILIILKFHGTFLNAIEIKLMFPIISSFCTLFYCYHYVWDLFILHHQVFLYMPSFLNLLQFLKGLDGSLNSFNPGTQCQAEGTILNVLILEKIVNIQILGQYWHRYIGSQKISQKPCRHDFSFFTVCDLCPQQHYS